MWIPATKQLTINGSVIVDVGGATLQPLRGVRVDVYRFTIDEEGDTHFELLNQAAARTSNTGDFSFSNLSVTVEVQEVIPSSPPYTPVEITNTNSLPQLAFRISVEAEVLTDSVSEGTQFVDIYDEREVIDATWVTAHPERIHVPLTGSPPLTVLIPEGHDEATLLAGLGAVAPAVPGKEVHLLRVGRATRDELTELGPTSAGRVGYMNSASPSFFPGIVDAPFGGTLQVGGHFGADFLTPPLSDNVYYTVHFSEYTGIHTNPFNPANLTNTVQILDPLFNKKYILPTPALPHGAWHALNLGPFTGTITAVEPPHDPGLVGSAVQVYERPGLPDLLTEYWPFWDLLVIWKSPTAPDTLIILTIEVYEKTGGTDTNPELTKLAVTSSVNEHLPLRIDNKRPVPQLLPYNPAIPDRKFHTAYATFIGVPEGVGPSTPMDICNEMEVHPGNLDGNECILVRYSVEDGSGNPHQHVNRYRIGAEYTPKAVLGAPDAKGIGLKPTFSGHANIAQNYNSAMATAPIMEVSNFTSVVVPANADAWPPEPCGDKPPGVITCDPLYPCEQYAMEVSLGTSVRTINGWGRLFSGRHVSRHIIIKRI